MSSLPADTQIVLHCPGIMPLMAFQDFGWLKHLTFIIQSNELGLSIIPTINHLPRSQPKSKWKVRIDGFSFSYFSSCRLTFYWLVPLLKLGYNVPLETSDVSPLAGSEQVKQIFLKLKEKLRFRSTKIPTLENWSFWWYIEWFQYSSESFEKVPKAIVRLDFINYI